VTWWENQKLLGKSLGGLSGHLECDLYMGGAAFKQAILDVHERESRQGVEKQGSDSEWEQFRKAQIKMFPKTPPPQLWPSQFRTINIKFKDRKRRLTLTPILEQNYVHDYEELGMNERMGQGKRKKEFDSAIRDGSMNWMECVMRSNGLKQPVTQCGEVMMNYWEPEEEDNMREFLDDGPNQIDVNGMAKKGQMAQRGEGPQKAPHDNKR
jgi:hypothetical protein